MAAAEVEAEVENLIAFRSIEGVSDPLETLSRLADESQAMMEALAARVNFLAQEDQLRYKASGSGNEQLRAEVALYERAMDRTAKLMEVLVKSGFEERRVRVSEQTGELVAQAVRVILAGMLESVRRSLTTGGPVSVEVLERVEADWRKSVGEVVPGALRSLGEGTSR